MPLAALWLLALPAALLWDALAGDPGRLCHPVQVVGAAISLGERGLRRLLPRRPRWELAGGALLAAAIPLCGAGVVWALCVLAARFHLGAWLAVEVLLGGWLLAANSLGRAAMGVHRELARGDLPAARRAVARIVGRDTAELDEGGVARAAVETVAENTTDGVVAPLLALAVAGASGCMFYKAVNTLDSMVGYRNERYLHFGRASARLDDVVNYLPARLSALCLVGAAALLPGMSARGAWRVWRADGRKHPSPNSAQTEAACAGALGVELAGPACYGGVWSQKPVLGAGGQPARPEDIPRSVALMRAGAVLALLPGLLARGAVCLLVLYIL